MSGGAALPRRTREITVGVRGIDEVTVYFEPPASIDDANDLALVVSDWLTRLRRRNAEAAGGVE